MPVQNISTDAGSGVITRCSGILGADEFITAIRQRYEPDERLRKIRYFLTDHTAVERFDLSTEDIIELTRITTGASHRQPHCFLATVVSADHAYGLVRMWQGYANLCNWECGLFRGMDEAQRWLRQKTGSALNFE